VERSYYSRLVERHRADSLRELDFQHRVKFEVIGGRSSLAMGPVEEADPGNPNQNRGTSRIGTMESLLEHLSRSGKLFGKVGATGPDALGVWDLSD
jgi:hypothetical protein